MKYNRLTKRIAKDEEAFLFHSSLHEAIDRLAELEDKIENGELISTVQSEQGEQEIAYFVKHNAEVRKQAVKEFAEICKEKFSYAGGTKPFRFYVCSEQGIDEIVKEVCGE